MTTTLYEMTDKYLQVAHELDNPDSDKETLTNLLNEVQEDIQDKIEAIGKVILSQEADLKVVTDEISRLNARSKTIGNKISWLKEYALQEMVLAKIEKVKREVVTVSVRTNPPSVNVIDENSIPDDYRVTIPESWQVDKQAINQHFKDTGELTPGTEMITDKKRIEVR